MAFRNNFLINNIRQWQRTSESYRLEILIFLLALIIYIPGVNWGLPYASGPEHIQTWAVDEIAPLHALTEVYHTFVETAPDRWLPYPLAHHFLVTAAYSPYLLWLKFSGQFGTPNPIYPYGFADPVTSLRILTLIARSLSLLMAAGIVVLAHLIGMTLWDKKTGIFASIIVLTVYPMFYYSKTANLEVPYLFWAALAMLIYVRILSIGMNVRRAAWLSAFAGLATATKDQAAGLFLLLPVILMPLHFRDWRAGKVSLWGPLLTLVLVGTVVYAMASGLILDPRRYFDHINFIVYDNALMFANYVEIYPFSFSGLMGLTGELTRAVFWVLGPLLTIVVVFALLMTYYREPIKLAFLLPAISYFVTFILPIQYFRLRYIFPLIFIVGIFAARGVVLSFEAINYSKLVKSLWFSLLFVMPIFLTVDLAFEMFNDSRYAAGEWFATHLTEGDRIAYFGDARRLPRLKSNIDILQLPPGLNAIDYLEKYRPEFIVLIPDWTSSPGMIHTRLMPDEFYQRLEGGSLNYRLATQFETNFLVQKQLFDHPSVNPPIRIFVRTE